MQALVYHGPGRRWDDVPAPSSEHPEDALVRVDAVTICGTDLHILKGDVPTVESPRILGHEAVGTVLDVGGGVRQIHAGDRVLVSCIVWRRRYCREARYDESLRGGGVDPRSPDRRPRRPRTCASRSPTPRCTRFPESVSDEAALMLADILPTSYRSRCDVGAVRGDVVAMFAGPIGLAAVITARLLTPSAIVVIDPAAARRDAAKRFGADAALDPSEDVLGALKELTDGLGADVAIEAVGVPRDVRDVHDACQSRRARGQRRRARPPCDLHSSRCGSAT